jgi:hypothetical protein
LVNKLKEEEEEHMNTNIKKRRSSKELGGA